MKATQKDIVQWDVRSWAKGLKYWERSVDWSKVNRGMELGGNSGGLSLWLAERGVEVLCTDLENVEKLAKPLHIQFGVQDKVTYQDIDATNVPYENHFDIVVFKSILGGVGRDNQFEKQKRAVEEMHKALKPGGILLFSENLLASYLHQFARKHFLRWGDSWRYMDLNKMKEVLQPFESYTLHTTGFAATFGRNEWQRDLLARLDYLVFNRFVPTSWHYICYGHAIK